ncbi:5-formyltetrahydrofolate cyclo-ligase [Oikeobacillus pervagus]|uniref:5-formyltetrahydrofolate cyclo-ligase n=1 Tax=Oikeobacillus pervagus TaxID=1325931 RepID=A0AAJ1WI04_9BACI|nr:5-formyltetrahydrofolate cyclo-ligase [Oikeobacillus pervagus]MDQ0213873.1 5-formyltetrahydrofolate cyclo-ligase [Oikeobacillus pervagus]
MIDKKTIRERLKKELAKISQQAYEEKSNRIAHSLFSQNQWKKSDTIGITISRFPEVDTYSIIKQGWTEGKQMVVPKCEPKTKQMHFFKLESFDQLETVYFGLLEPNPTTTMKVDQKAIQLLIVPGLAYTRGGYRLGFGGGYYDRFLQSYAGETMSLAFSEQLQDELPIEQHDLSVEQIITDHEVIICE